VDYIASYNNRMLYFVGSRLWWSSAGRPEEVAQEYHLTYAQDNSETPADGYGGMGYGISSDPGGSLTTITTDDNHNGGANFEVVISRSKYSNGRYWATSTGNNSFTIPVDFVGVVDNIIWSFPQYTVTNLPRTSLGLYAETKYDVAELDGQTVKGTFLKDGKLWLGTTALRRIRRRQAWYMAINDRRTVKKALRRCNRHIVRRWQEHIALADVYEQLVWCVAAVT
jgi:hypothetical protein